MKKTFLGSLLALSLITVFAAPLSALAVSAGDQGVGSDNPANDGFQIIPCTGVVNQQTKEGVECNYATLMSLLSRVVKFLLYLAVPLVLGIIIYTAFKFLTANGDPGKLADAKKMLIPVFIGIVCVLGAWILVRTFLDQLLADNVGGQTKSSFLDTFFPKK